MAEHKCCICGKDFLGNGHNPWPVKEEDSCCDICNAEAVIPARNDWLNNPDDPPRFDLPKCVTGVSKSGVCGNRACIEKHGIGCCIACPEREDCNVTCGWLEEPAIT